MGTVQSDRPRCVVDFETRAIRNSLADNGTPAEVTRGQHHRDGSKSTDKTLAARIREWGVYLVVLL